MPTSAIACQQAAAVAFFDIPQLRQELYAYLDTTTLINIALLKKDQDYGLLREVADYVFAKPPVEVMCKLSMQQSIYRNAVRAIRWATKFSSMEYKDLIYGYSYADEPTVRPRIASDAHAKIRAVLDVYPSATQINFDDAIVDLKPGTLEGHVTETCTVTLPAGESKPGRGPAEKEGDIPGYTHTRLVDVRLCDCHPIFAIPLPAIPRWATITSITDETPHADLRLRGVLNLMVADGLRLDKLETACLVLPYISERTIVGLAQAGHLNSLRTLDIRCGINVSLPWSRGIVCAERVPATIGMICSTLCSLRAIKISVQWEDLTVPEGHRTRTQNSVISAMLTTIDVESAVFSRSNRSLTWLIEVARLRLPSGRANFIVTKVGKGDDHQEAELWTSLVKAWSRLDVSIRAPLEACFDDLDDLGIGHPDELSQIVFSPHGKPVPVLTTHVRCLSDALRNEVDIGDDSLARIEVLSSKVAQWTSKKARELKKPINMLLDHIDPTASVSSRATSARVDFDVEDWALQASIPETDEALKRCTAYVRREFDFQLLTRVVRE